MHLPSCISALPSRCTDALRSALTVSSLESCLREVLENSIDAEATSLSVRLHSCGGFVVCDDGRGIDSEAVLQLLGTRYTSSKSTLTTSRTLGYRGEALASIAQVARLHVVSRKEGCFETAEAVLGPGGLEVRRSLCPPDSLLFARGGSGTRVEVSGFLVNGASPAAQHSSRQHARTFIYRKSPETSVAKYVNEVLRTTLPFPSIDVQVEDAEGRTLLSLPKGRSLPAWAARVLLLGKQQLSPLPWITQQEALGPGGQESLLQGTSYKLQGLILGPDHARPAPDLQFAYVNGRRVALPTELQDVVESAFRSSVLRLLQEESYRGQQRQGTGKGAQGADGGGSKSGGCGSRGPASQGSARAQGSIEGLGASERHSAAAAHGSSHLGSLGKVHASYVLLLECPPDDVIIDAGSGVSDSKAGITLKHLPTAKALLKHLVHRALSASDASLPPAARAAASAAQVGNLGATGAAAAAAPPPPPPPPPSLASSAGGPAQVSLPLHVARGDAMQAAVLSMKPTLLHPQSRNRSVASLHAVRDAVNAECAQGHPQQQRECEQEQQQEQQQHHHHHHHSHQNHRWQQGLQQRHQEQAQEASDPTHPSFPDPCLMPCLSGMMPWLKASASGSGAPAQRSAAPAQRSGTPAQRSGAPAQMNTAPAQASNAPAQRSGVKRGSDGSAAGGIKKCGRAAAGSLDLGEADGWVSTHSKQCHTEENGQEGMGKEQAADLASPSTTTPTSGRHAALVYSVPHTEGAMPPASPSPLRFNGGSTAANATPLDNHRTHKATQAPFPSISANPPAHTTALPSHDCCRAAIVCPCPSSHECNPISPSSPSHPDPHMTTPAAPEGAPSPMLACSSLPIYHTGPAPLVSPSLPCSHRASAAAAAGALASACATPSYHHDEPATLSSPLHPSFQRTAAAAAPEAAPTLACPSLPIYHTGPATLASPSPPRSHRACAAPLPNAIRNPPSCLSGTASFESSPSPLQNCLFTAAASSSSPFPLRCSQSANPARTIAPAVVPSSPHPRTNPAYVDRPSPAHHHCRSGLLARHDTAAGPQPHCKPWLEVWQEPADFPGVPDQATQAKAICKPSPPASDPASPSMPHKVAKLCSPCSPCSLQYSRSRASASRTPSPTSPLQPLLTLPLPDTSAITSPATPSPSSVLSAPASVCASPAGSSPPYSQASPLAHCVPTPSSSSVCVSPAGTSPPLPQITLPARYVLTTSSPPVCASPAGSSPPYPQASPSAHRVLIPCSSPVCASPSGSSPPLSQASPPAHFMPTMSSSPASPPFSPVTTTASTSPTPSPPVPPSLLQNNKSHRKLSMLLQRCLFPQTSASPQPVDHPCLTDTNDCVAPPLPILPVHQSRKHWDCRSGEQRLFMTQQREQQQQREQEQQQQEQEQEEQQQREQQQQQREQQQQQQQQLEQEQEQHNHQQEHRHQQQQEQQKKRRRGQVLDVKEGCQTEPSLQQQDDALHPHSPPNKQHLERSKDIAQEQHGVMLQQNGQWDLQFRAPQSPAPPFFHATIPSLRSKLLDSGERSGSALLLQAESAETPLQQAESTFQQATRPGEPADPADSAQPLAQQADPVPCTAPAPPAYSAVRLAAPSGSAAAPALKLRSSLCANSPEQGHTLQPAVPSGSEAAPALQLLPSLCANVPEQGRALQLAAPTGSAAAPVLQPRSSRCANSPEQGHTLLPLPAAKEEQTSSSKIPPPAVHARAAPTPDTRDSGSPLTGNPAQCRTTIVPERHDSLCANPALFGPPKTLAPPPAWPAMDRNAANSLASNKQLQGQQTAASGSNMVEASPDGQPPSLVQQLLQGWNNPMKQQRLSLVSRAVLSIDQLDLLSGSEPGSAASGQGPILHSNRRSRRASSNVRTPGSARQSAPSATDITNQMSSCQGKGGASQAAAAGKASLPQQASLSQRVALPQRASLPQRAGQPMLPSAVARQDIGPGCRVLGQVDKQYIMCISARGVMLAVDQHAAHERVRLEHLVLQLRAALNSGGQHSIPRSTTALAQGSQQLISPSSCFPQSSMIGGVRVDGTAAAPSRVPRMGGPSHGLVAAVVKRRARREGTHSAAVLTNHHATRVPEPEPLTSRRLGGGEMNGEPIQLSTQEWCAWLQHKQLVQRWGWDLVAAAQGGAGPGTPMLVRHGHTDEPGYAPTAATMEKPGCGGSLIVEEVECRGLSVPAVLLQVPVVFGVPLGAPDLRSYLTLLQDCGSVPALATGSVQAVMGISSSAGGGGGGGEGEGQSLFGGKQGQGGADESTQPKGSNSAPSKQGPESSDLAWEVAGAAAVQLLPSGVVRVLRSRSCRSALMFGDNLLQAECEDLVRLLEQCQLWHICAHGRPTVVPLACVPVLTQAMEFRQRQYSGLEATVRGRGKIEIVCAGAEGDKVETSSRNSRIKDMPCQVLAAQVTSSGSSRKRELSKLLTQGHVRKAMRS